MSDISNGESGDICIGDLHETGASRTVRNPFSEAPANRSRPTGSGGAGASAVSKERVNGPEERGSWARCRIACAYLAWGAGGAGAAEGAGGGAFATEGAGERASAARSAG